MKDVFSTINQRFPAVNSVTKRLFTSPLNGLASHVTRIIYIYIATVGIHTGIVTKTEIKQLKKPHIVEERVRLLCK